MVDFLRRGVYVLIDGILIQPAPLLLYCLPHLLGCSREESPLLDLLPALPPAVLGGLEVRGWGVKKIHNACFGVVRFSLLPSLPRMGAPPSPQEGSVSFSCWGVLRCGVDGYELHCAVTFGTRVRLLSPYPPLRQTTDTSPILRRVISK